jgi:hypothetical protein
MKWSVYNQQSLVRRGEISLAFDIINNWDTDLRDEQKDKIGEPFPYPNTFLLLLGYAKVYFHLPYRQAEGIAKALFVVFWVAAFILLESLSHKNQIG